MPNHLSYRWQFNHNIKFLRTKGGQTNETLISIEANVNDQRVKFLTLRLYLVDTSGKKMECLTEEITLDNDIKTVSSMFTFSKGKLLKDKNHCLLEDVLQNCLANSTKILKENLESSNKENLLCDTKLQTQTRSFPVHKYILSARSSVFKAMLINDMKKKNSECVDIEDLDDDTVLRMLLYINTATVSNFQWDSACNLYAAADKYKILTQFEK
ncbi:hypothetical protein TNCV_743751 [Trichonephila clavipes]|nr:hypothetical protein TNCV_743751 [Trichonephila clavipes]